MLKFLKPEGIVPIELITARGFSPKSTEGLCMLPDLQRFTLSLNAIMREDHLPPIVVNRCPRTGVLKVTKRHDILAAYETLGVRSIPVVLESTALPIQRATGNVQPNCQQYKTTKSYQLIDGLIEHKVTMEDKNGNVHIIFLELIDIEEFHKREPGARLL